MFLVIVGSMLGVILLIGIAAQVQKRGRQPFYPAPARDDFAETERFGSGPNGL